jgi:hypothetical protein
MSTFTIGVDKIHIIFQRSSLSSDGDNDWIVFTVGVNDRIAGEIKGVISGIPPSTIVLNPGGTRTSFKSGADIAFSPPCEIGPVAVGPNDTLSFFCQIINQSASENDKQASDFLKFAGSSAQIIGRVISAFPPTEAVGQVLNGLGESASALGEVLGWLKLPNCNGLVFVFGFAFSGAQLQTFTSASAHINPRKDDTQHSQSGCGQDPATEVTFSIRDAASYRQYVQVRGLHPSPGLRSILPLEAHSLADLLRR